MDSENKPDILAETLGRIGTGELPRSPFELLHHPKTREIVVQATRETMSARDMEATLLKQAPMNPVTLHEILTQGKGFQDRDAEAVEEIITEDFIASVERQVAACLAPNRPGDRIHDLLVRIPVIVEELTLGNHPMTLAEVKLFEERTQGKFPAHRDAIAKDGKKPEHTGLTGHPSVVAFMHRNIGNTVWINLMLAAIETDDHEAIPALLADAPVGDKSRDMHIIMKYILSDPVLHVTPSMFNALVDTYQESPGCVACVSGFIQDILRDEDLRRYRTCIPHIGQVGLRRITRREGGSFMLEICQNCSKDEIRGVLQIDELTNIMREHLQTTMSVAIQLLRKKEHAIYQIQIELLREIASEFQIELSADVK